MQLGFFVLDGARSGRKDVYKAGSSRPEEQARRLQGLLSTLSSDDRALVLEVVERLVERLSRG